MGLPGEPGVVLTAVLVAVLVGVVAGGAGRRAAARYAAGPPGESADAGAVARGRSRSPGRPRGVAEVRRPPVAEAAGGLVCGLVAWKYATGAGAALLAACLYLAAAGVVLASIDWRTMRLPDSITLPSYPILMALLIPSGGLVPGVYGMLALGSIYGLLWFVRPGGLGLGDVKLAGLIGLVTGALGPGAWVVAAVGGHLLGGLYAAGLLVTRRGTLKSEFPFGPFMLTAAYAAVLLV